LFEVQYKTQKVEFNIRLNSYRRFSLSILGKNPSPLPARESNTVELLATEPLACRIMIILNKAVTVIHKGFYLLWDSAFVDSMCSVVPGIRTTKHTLYCTGKIRERRAEGFSPIYHWMLDVPCRVRMSSQKLQTKEKNLATCQGSEGI
jgi:hypothetical protein